MSKPLARIGQRFTSQYIDSAAALAVAVVFYFLAKMLELANGWVFFGFLLYLLPCDGLPGGQSLGKRVTKTSVVHVVTDKPCTYWQSCVRNSSMLLGVVDAGFIVGKQRRRLGDLLARTKVVQVEAQ